MDLKNVGVIITGGASGMGAACGTLLTQLGAKVSLLDINMNALVQTAKAMQANPIQCDVSNSDSVSNALEAAEKTNGPTRICINCAGIIHTRRMVNQQGPMPLEEFHTVINVNLIGTFNVMRLASAKMIPLPLTANNEERGIIINTASIAAFEGQIGQTAYSASKGGIISMTLPAARELAQFAIRVMTIAPGLVDTPLFDKLSTDAKEQLTTNVPLPKRLASPLEYAKLVQHIIENPMLNGEVIRLDGALRMQAK